MDRMKPEQQIITLLDMGRAEIKDSPIHERSAQSMEYTPENGDDPE